MKRLISLVIIVMASQAFATDIETVNPKMSIDGSTVTMKADVQGVAISQEVKILVEGYGYLSETAVIMQPIYDRVYNTGLNKTSFAELYANGWRLSTVVPYAEFSYYYIFVR